MKKKEYVTPVAVVKSACPIDGIMYVSGPGVDPDGEANPDEEVEARENHLDFSDDWFDYDSSSDL